MAKGIEYRPVPKEWYDWKVNVVNEGDDEETIKTKEFNQRILANKKPYFMIYNYSKLKKEHNDYKGANDTVCKALFKMTTDELRDKEDKTDKELEGYAKFAVQCPTNVSPSLTNKIAWKVEKHFAQKSLFTLEQFDTDKLKCKGVTYSTQKYNKVAKLKEEYGIAIKDLIINSTKTIGVDIESQDSTKELIVDHFISKVYEVCGSVEVACNILVDLCYSDTKSKQLLWDCCGEQLIKNLIANGYNTLHVPVKSDNGDIEYKGMKFEIKEVDANAINWE